QNQFNKVQVIPGKGLPFADDSSSRGNLLVRIKLTVPEKDLEKEESYQTDSESDSDLSFLNAWVDLKDDQDSDDEESKELKSENSTQESAHLETDQSDDEMKQDPPIKAELQLTLEELIQGCTKHKIINRHITKP